MTLSSEKNNTFMEPNSEEFYFKSLEIFWEWEWIWNIAGNLYIISSKFDEYFSELGYTLHIEVYTESGVISVSNFWRDDFKYRQFQWLVDFQEFLKTII